MMLEKFKSEVEAFLEETGITPSRLGREALKDPCFVFGLRKGTDPRAGTIEKVQGTMRELRKASRANAA
jgi:predicted transcriptional regulator